jgi:AcrR family transcriptional regulator
MATDGRSGGGRARASRDELRARRREAILERALEIVTDEGHDALTMPRLASDLDCGVASVYRVFASKDALVAELLLGALEVLQASWRRGLEEVRAEAATRGMDEARAALAVAVSAAWFWVVGSDSHPPQMDLARRLFVDQRIVVPTDQAVHVLPAALQILNEGRQAIDDAADAGALRPGNGVERAIVVVASVTGVVQTGKFARWNAALFDARHLAESAVRDSFTAWGADEASLDAAFAVAHDLAASGRLSPQ